MGIFSIVRKLVVICISVSVQLCCAGIIEDLVPTKPAPFHNLIPRFKIPPGNLLRYKIPQWEVLYFLKYGIVPFIFYDPRFNRTNFITQVHKFKTYFDYGAQNRTSKVVLKDDEAFRDFLRAHGYPNIYQLPEDALSQNNKIAEEINSLLQAAKNLAATEKNNLDDKDDQFPTIPPSLEASINDLDRERQQASSTDEIILKRKRSYENEEGEKRSRSYFWNTFITRYPLKLRYSGYYYSGVKRLLLMPDSAYDGDRDFRIGTRNVNTRNGDADAGSGPGDSRRDGKTFQTQGW